MMEKTKIVLASRNKGKVAELQRLLAAELGDGIELVSLDDVGITGEIEENGKTFAENAYIKASAAAASGYPGLGDDSGLADALSTALFTASSIALRMRVSVLASALFTALFTASSIALRIVGFPPLTLIFLSTGKTSLYLSSFVSASIRSITSSK